MGISFHCESIRPPPAGLRRLAGFQEEQRHLRAAAAERRRSGGWVRGHRAGIGVGTRGAGGRRAGHGVPRPGGGRARGSSQSARPAAGRAPPRPPSALLAARCPGRGARGRGGLRARGGSLPPPREAPRWLWRGSFGRVFPETRGLSARRARSEGRPRGGGAGAEVSASAESADVAAGSGRGRRRAGARSVERRPGGSDPALHSVPSAAAAVRTGTASARLRAAPHAGAWSAGSCAVGGAHPELGSGAPKRGGVAGDGRCCSNPGGPAAIGRPRGARRGWWERGGKLAVSSCSGEAALGCSPRAPPLGPLGTGGVSRSAWPAGQLALEGSAGSAPPRQVESGSASGSSLSDLPANPACLCFFPSFSNLFASFAQPPRFFNPKPRAHPRGRWEVESLLSRP